MSFSKNNKVTTRQIVGLCSAAVLSSYAILYAPNYLTKKHVVGGNDIKELSEGFPSDSFTQYLQFISKYGKEQMSQKEFWLRFDIFKKNYKRVLDHNAIPDSGFEVEINHFSDLTDEEFVKYHTGLIVPKHKTESLKGLRVEPEDEEDVHEYQADGFISRRLLADTETTEDKMAPEDKSTQKKLPLYKDWNYEGYVSLPYDQGRCGGCWAFSTAAALESLAKLNGLNDKLEEYSV